MVRLHVTIVTCFPAKHQDKIIAEGILGSTLKLLSSDKVPLQLKALAVLQHFDGTLSVPAMIKDGFISHLDHLISSPNMQLRLKSLEVVRSLLSKYQEDLREAGILRKLVTFLADPDHQTKLEALKLLSRSNGRCIPTM